jgi:hypothetical protein
MMKANRWNKKTEARSQESEGDSRHCGGQARGLMALWKTEVRSQKSGGNPRDCGDRARGLVALWKSGVRSQTSEGNPRDCGGQARGLMALWLASCSLILAPAAFCQDDVVMRAMRDELARSMKKLQLENLDKPYFISYSVGEAHANSAIASFGSLTASYPDQPSRFARIQVRVGDYKFDNRNFFSYSFGNGVSRGFGNSATLPLDDNYDELRRQLWLATDGAYKKALEDLSKKRALLANKNRSEELPDFSKESAVTISDVLPPAVVKLSEMEAEVRELSALFKEAPGIFTSSVSFRASNEFYRYVNSEGTSYTMREPEITMTVTAESQAPDGQPLSSQFSIHARNAAYLPARERIAAQIKELSADIAKLRNAPLPDRYAGPVLFEGNAAAEIVFRSFVPHVLAMPEVLVDNPQYRSFVAQDSDSLVEKIGLRVLPEFLSMVDDPGSPSFGATKLLGGYKVDDEGVPTRRMQIVENGLLTKLLTGRAPVTGILQSSGSHHYGGVTPTNVIITSSKSLSTDALRAELLRRAKLRGKDYAIIVRAVDYPNRGSDSGGGASRSLPVLLAYKRFADGHEELVRNATINGISLGSFKDILAVSDTPVVWNASFRPRGMDPFEGPGTTFVSMVVPALLFEDATVQKATGNFNKPPLIEHPYFSKK